MTDAVPSGDYRVLLLPATRRDAQVIQALLQQADIACEVCNSAQALAHAIEVGGDVLLLTDAAFQDPDFHSVLHALTHQPPWSDLPIVLLCRSQARSTLASHVIRSLSNVTVLERPTSSQTLVSSVKAAVRARQRQYQMREQFQVLSESETALKTATQALQDSNRRKDEFLAMLAHELRNPLAPIQNATEVLTLKLATDPQIQSTVNIVQRQVKHLARLVDDLLDVSRITENRIELRREPLEISAIVAQAVESVEPLMREKGHTLLVEASYGRLYVNGDHARLVQSVTNVLINAAKYTDPGGEIRLEVQPRDRTVAIIVSDDGIGISAELLSRIFDLFVQGDRSLDRSQGGLGIGLSVVRRLIEMHGGQVAARSEGVGRGSTFELQLPLTERPQAIAEKSATGVMQPKRILVIDDNIDSADSLAALLRLHGHDTGTVYSAREAIARAVAEEPDVVLLDIGLPEMDGYEVAKRIRSRLDSVQLIALTGYGQAEDIRRAHAVGFNAHVVKPVDLELLRRMIQGFGAPSAALTPDRA